MNQTDTIFAVSSPPGEAALAIIRLSGPMALSVASAIFNRTEDRIRPRYAHYGVYRNLVGEVVDDLVYTYYQSGASFTGDAMLELTPHGNPLIVQKILEDLESRGLRPAEPGEFTRNAFLNGRLDLSQAEGIGDLIHARSERALEAARRQMRGAIGERMSELTGELLGIVAYLEAYIDFPEEDLPPEDTDGPVASLVRLRESVRRLLETHRYDSVLRNGVKTLIVGAPNVGKSSLINALTGRHRAIVSSLPGTTRDSVEDSIMIAGYRIQIMDTAGLRESEDEIERMGMAMTLEKAAEADFFLVVVSVDVPQVTLPEEVARYISAANGLLLINKSDLAAGSAPTKQAINQWGLEECPISALHGDGLDELRLRWSKKLAGLFAGGVDDGVAINARHSAALRAALVAINDALDKLQRNESTELAVVDLRDAMERFGEVVGKIDNESMLDLLFQNFCIGK